MPPSPAAGRLRLAGAEDEPVSVAVGTLSKNLLTKDRKFCFLYTDLANPVSNSIYAKLGYRPVADVMDVEIHPAAGSRDRSG